MHEITDLAITLKTIIFEERHRMIHALTLNHGKITLVARNSIQSRRFGGALEPFCAGEWTWKLKENHAVGYLERAEVKRAYDQIRQSFDRLSHASILNELVLRMAPENEPCMELFKLHANALALIEENEPNLQILTFSFLKLLQWSGHQPQIDACLLCERLLSTLEVEELITWSIAEAGWLCSECTSKHPGQRLQSPALRAKELLHLLNSPIRKAFSQTQNENESGDHASFLWAKGLLLYHIPGLDQVPLKSLRFVE
jgi:DNA repair protein RecO